MEILTKIHYILVLVLGNICLLLIAITALSWIQDIIHNFTQHFRAESKSLDRLEREYGEAVKKDQFSKAGLLADEIARRTPPIGDRV
ncbi:MAG: hypothetical protein Q8O98_01810 [bacterium]|nr:hypothetical protein [bacterium]